MVTELDDNGYSGSDMTNTVVSIVDKAIDNRTNKSTSTNDVAELKRALKLENTSNWLGFIWGLIGLIQFDLNLSDAAEESFRTAMSYFKQYKDDFIDVSNIYCQASHAYGMILASKDKYDEAICAYHQSLYHMETIFGDDTLYLGNTYYSIGLCLNQLGRDAESRVFLEHACFIYDEKQAALERLMCVYSNLGMKDKAVDTYYLIINNYPDYEDMNRVCEFAEQQLGIE